MEDNLIIEELPIEEVTEPVVEEPELIPLYLVLDDTNRVIDISLTDGIYYQDIPPDADLESIKTSLNIQSQAIFWDGYLYEKKPDLEAENAMLKRQVATLSSELEIRDDLLQEIILATYQ